jgi:enolase-phosphatase E1
VQFPYALKALPDVLKTQWDSDEFKAFRDAFPEEFRESPEALQAHVEDLTKRDVKVAYLKGLQGYLWEYGYESGEYSTPLFPDVVPKLKSWIDDGRKIAIYSSGSVFAQKLLFGHVKSTTSAGVKRGHEDVTDGSARDDGPPSKKRAATETTNGAARKATVEAGGSVEDDNAPASESKEEVPRNGDETEDLRHLISNWFDTTNAGPKTEAGSYATIATMMEVS